MPEETLKNNIVKLCYLLNKYSVPGIVSYEWTMLGENKYIVLECVDQDANSPYALSVEEAIRGLASSLASALREIKRDTTDADELIGSLSKRTKYGGYSSYQAYLNSPHWKKIRLEALDRADWRCMLCNTCAGPLHVHHRTYDRIGNEDPTDVIVLCSTHHGMFHGKGGEV